MCLVSIILLYASSSHGEYSSSTMRLYNVWNTSASRSIGIVVVLVSQCRSRRFIAAKVANVLLLLLLLLWMSNPHVGNKEGDDGVFVSCCVGVAVGAPVGFAVGGSAGFVSSRNCNCVVQSQPQPWSLLSLYSGGELDDGWANRSKQTPSIRKAATIARIKGIIIGVVFSVALLCHLLCFNFCFCFCFVFNGLLCLASLLLLLWFAPQSLCGSVFLFLVFFFHTITYKFNTKYCMGIQTTTNMARII